eukprot:m.61110 g.61110  ORF g.61110 m.61110 type:complete len:424 (-) comp17524_c1_seq1:666-1937(-)
MMTSLESDHVRLDKVQKGSDKVDASGHENVHRHTRPFFLQLLNVLDALLQVRKRLCRHRIGSSLLQLVPALHILERACEELIRLDCPINLIRILDGKGGGTRVEESDVDTRVSGELHDGREEVRWVSTTSAVEHEHTESVLASTRHGIGRRHAPKPPGAGCTALGCMRSIEIQLHPIPLHLLAPSRPPHRRQCHRGFGVWREPVECDEVADRVGCGGGGFIGIVDRVTVVRAARGSLPHPHQLQCEGRILFLVVSLDPKHRRFETVGPKRGGDQQREPCLPRAPDEPRHPVIFLWTRHGWDAGLEDAALLERNLPERVAEDCGVIKPERGDSADHWPRQDVGGVEPPPQPHFNHRYADILGNKDSKRKERQEPKVRRHLRRGRVSVWGALEQVPTCPELCGELCTGDRNPVDPDPLAGFEQVW